MMNCRKLINILLVSGLLAAPTLSLASGLTARIDSVNLLMGRTAAIELTLDLPFEDSGYFPFLHEMGQKGRIGVCGDSVELRMPSKIDTLTQGGSRTIRMQVPVQSFDSGAYLLPAFTYVSGRDTLKSGRLALKVRPVPVKADTPIADYAGISDPENPSFFDWVPDWILDFWWAVLLVLLAGVGGFWAYRKYSKDGSLLPAKPKPTPYEVAMKDLAILKEHKLWEQGMEKEYFTELTRILREYLFGRFGINAMEMTSRQILTALKKNRETYPKRGYFRHILDVADFVKFAKVRPLPEDCISSFEDAKKFIEETRPVEPTESLPGDASGSADKSDVSDNSKKGVEVNNV